MSVYGYLFNTQCYLTIINIYKRSLLAADMLPRFSVYPPEKYGGAFILFLAKKLIWVYQKNLVPSPLLPKLHIITISPARQTINMLQKEIIGQPLSDIDNMIFNLIKCDLVNNDKKDEPVFFFNFYLMLLLSCFFSFLL